MADGWACGGDGIRHAGHVAHRERREGNGVYAVWNGVTVPAPRVIERGRGTEARHDVSVAWHGGEAGDDPWTRRTWLCRWRGASGCLCGGWTGFVR